MSTRRGRHQHTQSQSYQPPSDYESDVQFLSDAPPPPVQRTDEELNLAVLKRHNRAVISLEYVAPYAVVYQFSADSQQWEKSGIEGSAFVCRLQSTTENLERYEVIVLNRRGLENFNLELLSNNDVEVTEEYIILNSTSDGIHRVYGLWVFSEPPPSSTSHHRLAIARKIEECAERVELGRRPVIQEILNGYDEVKESLPMGRQLSLKELFGQQRQQDDAWSIRSHSPQRPPTQFTTSADTEFFRTPQRHSQLHSPAMSAQSNGQGRDVLMDLFRKAGEGYRAGP